MIRYMAIAAIVGAPFYAAAQNSIPHGPRADRFWAVMGPKVVALQWADEAVVCGLRSQKWGEQVNTGIFLYGLRIARNLWGSDYARIGLNMDVLKRVQSGSKGMAQDAPPIECQEVVTQGWLPELDTWAHGD